MKINQTTLDKIKAYILDTQANSTYNSAPHEPLEMCFYKSDWNMCNCYCYINRYLSTNGKKKCNVEDLFKCAHYAFLQHIQTQTHSFGTFKTRMNDVEYIDDFITYAYLNPDLIAVFKDDKEQVTDNFWQCEQYARLAILLIQQHLDKEYIDLETT